MPKYGNAVLSARCVVHNRPLHGDVTARIDNNSSVTLSRPITKAASERCFQLRLVFSHYLSILIHNDIEATASEQLQKVSKPMASKYTRCHVHYTMERSLAFQGKVRPPPKIVLLVSDYSLFGVRAAIKAPGVMGIVDKESSGVSILLEALKQVQEGGDFYTPAIARKAIDVVLHDHELELTLREETALRKLAETGSIAGAAQKLGGNTGTTYNYFSSIRRKFGLSHNANAQAIVAQAHELGYIQQKPKG